MSDSSAQQHDEPGSAMSPALYLVEAARPAQRCRPSHARRVPSVCILDCEEERHRRQPCGRDVRDAEMRIAHVKRGDRDVESRNDCSVAIEKFESNRCTVQTVMTPVATLTTARYQIVGGLG